MRSSILLNSVLLASLLALSHGVLKWVALQAKGGLWDLISEFWPYLAGAATIYFFIFVYYTQLLRHTDLNVLYPIYTALSILLVFTMGWLYFGEPVTTLKIIGGILIISGVFLVAY